MEVNKKTVTTYQFTFKPFELKIVMKLLSGEKLMEDERYEAIRLYVEIDEDLPDVMRG